MTTSAEIRERLATELRIDLIGPSHDDSALVNEILPDPPSRWYLTGFLVPVDTPPRRKARDPQEEMDTAEQGGADDDETPDRSASRPRYMPSSMGLSLLVELGTGALRVTCRWGDYHREEADENGGRKTARWRREQREVACDVPVTEGPPIRLPDTNGLELARQIRETQIRDQTGVRKVLAVSLFLVNRRSPSEEEFEDEAMAFQAEVDVESATPIVARVDLSGRDGDDIDARVADLHYRDVVDWAVGHNVSVAAAVVVAMARLAEGALTPNPRAADADQIRPQLNWIADVIRERVIGHKLGVPADIAAHVRARAVSLLDDWSSLAHDRNSDGTTFGYGREPGISKTLLHEVLERGLELADERERRFRTPRSFRDVEPPVLLRKVAPNGAEIDEDRT